MHVPGLPDRLHSHDPTAMVIFRCVDDEGAAVSEVDLLLTAVPDNDPDHLPSGFLDDRQANSRRPGCLTFLLNHALLAGAAAILDDAGDVVRDRVEPRSRYGLLVRPRDGERFVEYWPTSLSAADTDLLQYICPNETTIVDIEMSHVMREGVFDGRPTSRNGASRTQGRVRWLEQLPNTECQSLCAHACFGRRCAGSARRRIGRSGGLGRVRLGGRSSVAFAPRRRSLHLRVRSTPTSASATRG